MHRLFKAYTAELVVSKLRFPQSVTDLILDYGCRVNDYLLVLSTPSHTICEVWAMWADIPDICWGLRVRAYMRRFLGSWNYNNLLSLLCATGPGTKLSWIEVVVDMGRGRERYGTDKLICPLIHPAVFHTQHRLGRWVIGGHSGYPLYEYLALH